MLCTIVVQKQHQYTSDDINSFNSNKGLDSWTSDTVALIWKYDFNGLQLLHTFSAETKWIFPQQRVKQNSLLSDYVLNVYRLWL